MINAGQSHPKGNAVASCRQVYSTWCRVLYMTTQRYELEAWLGDDHGLTDDQVTDLLATANEIQERYPDPDDEDKRQAALVVAYRLISRRSFEELGRCVGTVAASCATALNTAFRLATGDTDVLDELARKLRQARIDEAVALAGLRQAALYLVPGKESEAGFARRAGLDRMAVRGWLGKR